MLETEFIKFGRAKSPQRRMLTLQTGCPHELALVAFAPWPDQEEPRIHTFLAEEAVRGEWFRRSDRTELLIGLLRDQNTGLDTWLKTTIRRRVDQTAFFTSRLAHHLKAVA